MKLPEGLTERQKLFVVHYIGGGCTNASAAAREAGYSPKSAGRVAHELLQREEIRDEVDRRQRLLMLRVQVSQDWVLERLMHEAVGGDTSSARVRSLELLGKHIGMWSERNVGSIQVYQQLLLAVEGLDEEAFRQASKLALDLVPDGVNPDSYRFPAPEADEE